MSIIGKSPAHYSITAIIAKGGMGEVDSEVGVDINAPLIVLCIKKRSQQRLTSGRSFYDC